MYKQREISSLKYTERRDCSVSMALATLVTAFTYRLEKAAGNPVELERFVRIGFVPYFENLLSALDSSAPGGAYDKSFTQDMIVAIESLGLVCFEVVEREEEVEDQVEERVTVAHECENESDTKRNSLISPALSSALPTLIRVPVPKDAKRGDVVNITHNCIVVQVELGFSARQFSFVEKFTHNCIAVQVKSGFSRAKVHLL